MLANNADIIVMNPQYTTYSKTTTLPRNSVEHPCSTQPSVDTISYYTVGQYRIYNKSIILIPNPVGHQSSMQPSVDTIPHKNGG